MSATTTVLRGGWQRGRIELRQGFTGADLIGQLFWPAVTLGAVYWFRDRPLGASGFMLGSLILPSIMGMFVAFSMLLALQYLTADREDGTLLRAKATPHGIRGYFLGKLITVSGSTVAYLVIIGVPGMFIVDGLDVGPGAWLTLAWVLALGLLAAQPIGAVLGSLITSARGAGFMSLPVMALIAISGVFYPITALPQWVQWVAQVFPIYWLGLGMRSALLPDAAAAVEIDASWRTAETVAVLGAWAVLGLVLAPLVLRRMARRESGSAVAARRDRALQRIG